MIHSPQTGTNNGPAEAGPRSGSVLLGGRMVEDHTESRNRKPLTCQDLDELRAKARALDEAVEWMSGRLDNETLTTVYYILTKRK
jgi:hypothetical protein